MYRQKKFNEAYDKYVKASSVTKNKKQIAAAFHNLGNALMEEKQYEKSIEAYKQSLKSNPKDDETRYNLAVAQYMLRQQQKQQQQQQKQQQQQQKQQQQQQNKDDKQKENDQQQKNKDNQQQKQNEKQKKDRDQAEQILQAIEQDERDVQEKRKIKMGQKAKVEKEW